MINNLPKVNPNSKELKRLIALIKMLKKNNPDCLNANDLIEFYSVALAK